MKLWGSKILEGGESTAFLRNKEERKRKGKRKVRHVVLSSASVVLLFGFFQFYFSAPAVWFVSSSDILFLVLVWSLTDTRITACNCLSETQCFNHCEPEESVAVAQLLLLFHNPKPKPTLTSSIWPFGCYICLFATVCCCSPLLLCVLYKFLARWCEWTADLSVKKKCRNVVLIAGVLYTFFLRSS